MELKKEHRYINLTNEEIPVSLGKIYLDRGHGGLTVRSIESVPNGYTKVEYIKKDGSFGWYDAITYDLCEPDPLEKLIFYELFNTGFSGEVRYLCLDQGYDDDSESFFGEFVGYFNLGDPVGSRYDNKIYGYVVSTNGHYLNPKGGNENGKVEIEYVDQSGNIARTCVMARYVYDLFPRYSEVLRKGLENFGYVFDKESMRIKKSGDYVLPIPYHSMMWKCEDRVKHIPSGRVGEIEQLSYNTATVKFEDQIEIDDLSEIVDLRDLKYIENYGG
jgi:hypothetical protein